MPVVDSPAVDLERLVGALAPLEVRNAAPTEVR